MQLDYTHICVVLDASGSMQTIKSDVVGALVGFCAEQRKKAESGEQIAVDLYQFNDNVNRLAHNAALDEFERLIDAYRCSGCTALYDAVCQGVDELGAFFAALPEDKRPEDVMFVIVTDGAENSSKRFNAAHVRERIERQREQYNWNFVFLASGIDVERAAADIGVRGDEAVEFKRSQAREALADRMDERMYNIRKQRQKRREE